MRVCVLVLLVLVPLAARAEDDPKAIFDRGTALFALRHFSEAAALYEKAFELRPDPAILYNAAQAHRLAGNKTRALDLYQSLLKLYGSKVANRAEIMDHIRHLQFAIDAERRATNSPPITPQPRPLDTGTRQPPPQVDAPPPPATPATPATATTLTAGPVDPVTKRKWFWPVIGSTIAVVVAGVTVGVVIGASKTVDPTPGFGNVRGN
jgi:tetratricopeptide (TPR) repeat protein